MADPVTLVEVGPRDGLQNEPRQIPTSDKIALVNLLATTGLRQIEVTSFVSPKWVPQMADAAQVLAGIDVPDDLTLWALTPNLQGYGRARDAGITSVAIFAAASEAFSARNINCTIDESFARFAPVVARATADGVAVRGYISCVTDCPYTGPMAPDAVAEVAARMAGLGVTEVSLGETLGKATPQAVDAMLGAVCARVPAQRLAGHFHDTGGRALANIDVALDHGIRVFDAAVGGLGGCPYAPGAAGNVATEQVAAHLAARGHETGLDPNALARAADLARSLKTREGA